MLCSGCGNHQCRTKSNIAKYNLQNFAISVPHIVNTGGLMFDLTYKDVYKSAILILAMVTGLF